MDEVENTPLEKRKKEEQIRTALRLERYAGLDKMKNLSKMAQWVRKISESTPVEKGGKT